MGKSGYIIVFMLGGLLLVVVFMSQIRRTFLNLRGETVTVNLPAAPGSGLDTVAVDLKIITVLGKDGIPAILDPQFLSPEIASDHMQANERVIGLSIDGDSRAYPLNMLSRHEIVNDTVGGVPVAVTWWPLCFTGIVYARDIDGSTHTFGVSGKLIKNALVMYDHQSDTLWSQFLSRWVKGPLSGTSLEILPALQTTWRQWLELHPDTVVLDKFGRYQRDTYEGYYRGGSAGILGEFNKDKRLSRKDLVLGVVQDGAAKAYPFRSMTGQPVINDFWAGKEVLVVFESISETGAVFERRLEDRSLTFEIVPGDHFLIRGLETGSTWQALTGRAIDGPLAGKVLARLTSNYSFWFAWSDFYPDTQLY